MAQLKRTVTIEAPLDQVFAFMCDPLNWPQVLPNLVEIRRISDHRYEGTYRMAGIPLAHTSQMSDVVANRSFKTTSRGTLSSSLTYIFEGVEHGHTRLTVDGSYDVPLPLLGRIAEAVLARINEREIGTALANLKDRLEAEQPAAV